MSWGWIDEATPPAPRGVVALNAVARRLWSALAQRDPSEQGRWQVIAHQDLLLLSGDTDQLPWVDGVAYVAPRAEAPGLWLSTTQRPQVALDLLQRAIQQRHGAGQYLLWREPAQIVPLARLQPLTPELLAQIDARWRH